MGLRAFDVEALYRTHIHDLRRFLRSVVKSDDEAEDLAHEAIIKVLRTMAEAEIVRPRTLLFTAAYHLAIDRLRRQRFERALFDRAQSAEQYLCDYPSAQQTIEDRQRLSAAIEAMDDMKPLRRQVLLRNRLDGLSYREIACETGLSIDSIEKHVSRAVTACREFVARRESLPARHRDALRIAAVA